MQTIGERLEEARRRKGISIRDAAEATKIRGDFLSSFENDSFETINLPEIYVRGFLKSYARFLKLDTDKIMTDYEAARMGHSKSGRGGGRDLGGLSIGGRYEESESSHGGSSTPKRVIPPHAVEAYDEDGDEDSTSRMEKQLYYKIGLICGSVFLGVLLLVLIINLFSGDDEVVANPPSQGSTVVDQTNGGTTNTTTSDNAAPTRETVTFRATGATAVQVYELRKDGNRTMLGGRQLTAGDSFQVTRDPTNELLVEFTSGANLRIETTNVRSDFSNYENYGRARIPASRR